MLKALGIFTFLRWFAIACVVLAIWRAHEGDLGAIVAALWSWLLWGSDVVQFIWDQVNSRR